MSYGTKDDPIEIMEGSALEQIKGVKKEDIRIKYLGTNRLITWKEHQEDVRKWDRKKAKAKLTKQLEKLPDAEPSTQESSNESTN